jgi:hypothetical protein
VYVRVCVQSRTGQRRKWMIKLLYAEEQVC